MRTRSHDFGEAESATGTPPRGFVSETNWAWPLHRAATLVELRYGKALVDSMRFPGNIPVYGTNGQAGWHDTALVEGPGVILGRKGMGNLGVEWSATDFWVIDTAYYVEPLAEIDLKFFYYLVKYVGLNHLKDGTSNPSLTRATFGMQLLPYPPLPDQRAIAHILSTLDDKIELNRQMNQTLEQIAAALFTSWFVDFDPVRAKAAGRQPEGMDAATAALFPDRLVESELGEIPEGWEIQPLGEWLSVLETGSRPKGGVKGISEGMPSIGAESINGLATFDYSKTKFVPDAFFQSMRKGIVHDLDVLLYKDGGRPGVFEPHVAMFGHGFPFAEFAINEHVYRLRASRPASQEYLYFWLTSDFALKQMRIRGTGVAVPGLNSTAVKSIPFLLPNQHVLAVFQEVAEPLVKMSLQNSVQSKTLADLRDALLPRLLSGELRVPLDVIDEEAITMPASPEPALVQSRF